MKTRLPSARRMLLTMALCASHALCLAHGFDKQVQELRDTEPAAIADGTTFTVTQLKDLLALRATPTGEGYIAFSLQDLLSVARQHPAYVKLAAEARAEGLALTDADRAHIDRFLRTHVERQLFARHIAARRIEPTREQLLARYEAQKSERFFLPERMVIRQLLFPANAEQEARKAWKRLEGGEDFAVLQNAAPPESQPPQQTQIIDMGRAERDTPALYAALRKLDADRRYSAPFEFGNSLAIVQRQLLIPHAFMSLESVQEVLREEWLNAEDTKAMSAFFKQVAGESRLIRIHSQNLGNAGALAFDSDVLLSLGKRDFTRGELRDALGWQVAPDLPMNERSFAEIAVMSAPVQRALLDHVIDNERLMDGEGVKQLRIAAEETGLVRLLLDKRFAASAPVVEDAAIATRAEHEGIVLTDESKGEIRRQLLEQQRVVFEIETLKAESAGAKFKALIGFAARGS